VKEFFGAGLSACRHHEPYPAGGKDQAMKAETVVIADDRRAARALRAITPGAKVVTPDSDWTSVNTDRANVVACGSPSSLIHAASRLCAAKHDFRRNPATFLLGPAFADQREATQEALTAVQLGIPACVRTAGRGVVCEIWRCALQSSGESAGQLSCDRRRPENSALGCRPAAEGLARRAPVPVRIVSHEGA
jgi:hypothetical protein